jgi:hypothetical protein
LVLEKPASPWKNALKSMHLSVDLRKAVMAVLSGGECCRWIVAELVERFKN